MREFAIKDFELCVTANRTGQGVAEVMFNYLPWTAFDASISFKSSQGWPVIDNHTGFQYQVSPV